MAAFSFVEVLFALGVVATTAAVAIPSSLESLDDMRAVGAARYVSARLQRTRMEAVFRGAAVGLRVKQAGAGYLFDEVVDGNRNGVLSTDIQSGVDRVIAPVERIGDRFPGVEFGAITALPSVDPSGTPPAGDPIRLGAADTAVFTPLGTATSGSLYILGRRNAQYVVRVFGESGKTRVLKFDPRRWTWMPLQDF